MGTPWTRVPQRAPQLDAFQLRLLPIADAFMWVMLSRPGGLSLRTTWVTPATIWLCLGVAVPLLPLAVGLLGLGITGTQPLTIVGGLVALAFGVGAGTVALFGVRQRILARDP
jgi:hypothetical protein